MSRMAWRKNALVAGLPMTGSSHACRGRQGGNKRAAIERHTLGRPPGGVAVHGHQLGAAQEKPVSMVESRVGQLIFRAADDDHTGIWLAVRADDRDTRRAKVVAGIALR